MTHLTVKRLGLSAAAALVPVLLFAFPSGSATDWLRTDGENLPRNRYIGAKACKNCHKAKSKGEQYQKWEDREHGHAKAFEVLASDKAKKIAKEQGIADPQKSDKCLQCHVTAHGAKKNEIKRGFKIEQGVQCESCHGPGELHAKTRFKKASSGGESDAYVSIPDDEIIKRPDPKLCLDCHNDKSPTFKPFCFKERRKQIEHMDPRVKRTPEQLKALECKCGKECKCKACECGGYEDKKTSEKGGAPK